MSRRMIAFIAKEVGDFLNDIRLSLPSAFMSLILPIFAVAGIRTLGVFLPESEAGFTSELGKVYFVSLVFVASFPLSLTVPVTLESFVGERERKTIEGLLLVPFSDEEFYLSKILSSFFPPLVLGGFSLLFYAVISYFFLPFYPPARLFSILFLLLVIKALLLVAAASVISSQSHTVRAANMASSLVILPATALIALESWCLFHYRYDLLFWIMVVLALYALLFLRLGLNLFDRESLILYANPMDELRRITQAFKRPLSALLDPVPWREAVILILFFVVGTLLGRMWAAEEIAAGRFVNLLSLIQSDPQGGFSLARANIGVGVDKIFGHNLQAVCFLVLLVPFSLGAIAGLFVVLPGFVIGAALATAESGLGSPSAVLRMPFLYAEIPAMIFVASYALKMGVSLFHRAENSSAWLAFVAKNAAGLFYAILFSLPLFFLAAVLEVHGIN